MLSESEVIRYSWVSSVVFEFHQRQLVVRSRPAFYDLYHLIFASRLDMNGRPTAVGGIQRYKDLYPG